MSPCEVIKNFSVAAGGGNNLENINFDQESIKLIGESFFKIIFNTSGMSQSLKSLKAGNFCRALEIVLDSVSVKKT